MGWRGFEGGAGGVGEGRCYLRGGESVAGDWESASGALGERGLVVGIGEAVQQTNRNILLGIVCKMHTQRLCAFANA